jgi:type IV secretion system protein VirB10
MRLSRKTLAAVGLVSSLSIGGALIYALRPTPPHQAEELFDAESRATADAINSAPSDYSEVPKLRPPLPGELGAPGPAAQQRGEEGPIPTGGPRPPDPAKQAAETTRQRAAQERDAARISNVFLSGSSSGRGAPQAIAEPAASPVVPSPTSTEASTTAQDHQRAFLDRRSGATTSAARLMRPVSPNIVQAGTIIPAALMTGISSDLPGQIVAQVTRNIYDSPTGRILLIPQGARLIGEYDSKVSVGQNRVLLGWDRLLLPDGRSIALERQPGADSAGMAGLSDRTDHHWGGMLKAALVSTLLGVGAELASDADGELVRALRDDGQDSVNQAGQQVVQRELNVRPTLTVRPGFPLNVVVTRDLVLEPIGGKR